MKKLLVIVPYRDRASHLKEFIPYIKKTLQDQNIENQIVVVEQSLEKFFNRGLLCNIGFYLYQHVCDYICIHDVDIIGENFDYSYEPLITHLSARWRDKNYKEFYPRCLGGVVLFPKANFLKINGFSNEYWGWGAEDDDLRLRCDIMDVQIQRKQGRFYSLSHETILWRDRPIKSPGYIQNINRLNQFKRQDKKIQKLIIYNDGVSSTKNYFEIIQTINFKNYILVKTSIK